MKGTPVYSRFSRTSTTKLTLLAAGALLALSACGSSGSSTASAGQPQGTTGQTGQAGGPGAGFGGGHFPGTTGQIAEVDGKTLQVQSASTGQVAVTWSGSTLITADVKATLADVKVGSCVTVMPVRSSTGTGGASSASTAAAAAGSSPSTGPVTAGTVRITQATKGSCDVGFGGGFGGHFGGHFRGNGSSGSGAVPSGAPGAVPSGAPSGAPGGLPSGVPGGRGGFRGGAGFGGGFGATGKVTAVTTTGFTVSERTFDPSNPSATPTTHAVRVTVSGATTYTTTEKAAGSALKVGTCVTAIGKANDTGAVTASRIQVSDPTNGSCGFGGFGGSRG